MSKPETMIRVIEVCPGEWICQFASGGPWNWTKLGDETFANQMDAEAFMTQQIADADWDAE